MTTLGRSGLAGLAIFGAALSMTACPASLDAECSGGACDADGGPSGSDAGGDVVGPPPGCDEKADTSEPAAQKCVVGEYGVFVAQGASGDGTKASPLGSIQKGIEKAAEKRLPRVYICTGTYEENVSITATSTVSLYGGFACGTWTYDGNRPQVKPSAGIYALTINSVASVTVEISDLEFVARPASASSSSSIALFFSKSKEVLLRRVTARASDGASAPAAAAPASNWFSATASDLDGNAAGGAAADKTCGCKLLGKSVGGKGGAAGNPAPAGGNGSADPAPTQMGARDGTGGKGYDDVTFSCAAGRPGSDGAAGTGGVASTSLGVLNENGWMPAKGGDGGHGKPGGGGGGGGGGDTNPSGGGACGGCGGAGGPGGAGGGSSFGLLAFQTSTQLKKCEFFMGDGGKGGRGADGEVGAAGGAGFVGGACAGGRGGNGAGGSGGAGGAGGASIGIGFVGPSPRLDGETKFTIKKAGDPGDSGMGAGGGMNTLSTAPTGANGAAGRAGESRETFGL